jgi:hypothetical protein
MNKGILVCKQLNQGKRSGWSKGAALAIGVTSVILSVSAPARAVKGGSSASITNYPYMGQLRLNGSFTCNAVLIDSTTALTEGSCVPPGPPYTSYSVLFGTSYLNDEYCATCELRGIASASTVCDVATLKFSSPIVYNANIQPINLATPADGNFVGETCTITSWGGVPNGGPLQQGEMTVIPNSDCASIWGSSRIGADDVCSISPVVTAGHADRGGALVCSSKLAGLISWGPSVPNPSYPTVSERVSWEYSCIKSHS